ncbi:XRE family transcriptional regulator [Nocardiopsis sp. LDBS1602]|uniref:XRE family transcriptional regulator n=1 Tax=Nocardiopsis sp. LDBS1602 TaxID=3109597 RepID=UPI002DB9889C|nr:XRE family transcriptional regulator [Nocardiopsis sp. LDBS1602]MEC3893573.1 XRE family transcriptional regulator [Nocardiopsis sp. LDBS1602]
MNAALRKALAAAQLTETDVAAHLGVDPKTVRRWFSGQRPYPRHRWALADLLQANEADLWAQENQTAAAQAPRSEHVQSVYAHRWQVPREVWWDLFSSAKKEIGILVYSGLFLADDAGILGLLEQRARSGVKTRILLGDPASKKLAQRGKEEGVGEAISARARNSMLLLMALADGIEVRLHSTVLYSSIFLPESQAIVNHHVYGIPASKSPLVLVDKHENPEISKIYRSSFYGVWDSSPVFHGCP